MSNAARRTQAERREATRDALIAAGRRLFAERGYADVASEELVAAAGVTRGALYHHFEGKLGLFEAVYEAVEQDLVARFPLERLVGGDPFATLKVAVGEVLELGLDPEVHQIALVDAPAVLGWEKWHEIELRYGLGLIIASLTAAAEAGQIRELPIPELANVLLGALLEASHYVSRADDRESALESTRVVLETLLDGLRP
jgi:AcrR family transcriptional regulator